MNRRDFLHKASLGGAGAVLSAAIARRPHAQPTAKKITIAIGTAPPDPIFHYLYYAQENGFFAQQGVAVEFKTFVADPTAIRALVAGEADIACSGAISCIAAIAAGAKLKCIAAIAPKFDSLVVAQKEIGDLAALAGKSIGIASMGGGTQIAVQLMVERAGIDPAGIHWVSAGGGASRVQALIARKVDAAPVNSAFATTALAYDYLHPIADTLQTLPFLLQEWESTSLSAIAAKPDALQGFLTAALRGARWGMDNPDQAAEISAHVLPEAPTPQLVEFARHFAQVRYWNGNGALAREAWDFTTGTMTQLGLLPMPPRYEDVYTPQFVEGALKVLGRAG